MAYKPTATMAKMALPALVPILGELLPIAVDQIDKDQAYLLGVILLSLLAGLKNWMKNRGRR